MQSAPKIREIPVHHEAIEYITCTTQDLPEKLGRAYGEIENWASKHRVRVSAPFARYTLVSPSQRALEAGFIADRSAPGDERIRVKEDGGYIALAATHAGPFSEIASAYAALEEFMHVHGYTSAGPPVEYYLTPPETPPDRQKTEIVWPVTANEV